MTACDPDSTALATAKNIPLSLKDPVGFNVSSLKYNSFNPSSGPKRLDLIKGVEPSPKDFLEVAAVTGRNSAYLSIR